MQRRHNEFTLEPVNNIMTGSISANQQPTSGGGSPPPPGGDSLLLSTGSFFLLSTGDKLLLG